jgi:hypothetical protein
MGRPGRSSYDKKRIAERGVWIDRRVVGMYYMFSAVRERGTVVNVVSDQAE